MDMMDTLFIDQSKIWTDEVSFINVQHNHCRHKTQKGSIRTISDRELIFEALDFFSFHPDASVSMQEVYDRAAVKLDLEKKFTDACPSVEYENVLLATALRKKLAEVDIHQNIHHDIWYETTNDLEQHQELDYYLEKCDADYPSRRESLKIDYEDEQTHKKFEKSSKLYSGRRRRQKTNEPPLGFQSYDSLFATANDNITLNQRVQKQVMKLVNGHDLGGAIAKIEADTIQSFKKCGDYKERRKAADVKLDSLFVIAMSQLDELFPRTDTRDDPSDREDGGETGNLIIDMDSDQDQSPGSSEQMEWIERINDSTNEANIDEDDGLDEHGYDHDNLVNGDVDIENDLDGDNDLDLEEVFNVANAYEIHPEGLTLGPMLFLDKSSGYIVPRFECGKRDKPKKGKGRKVNAFLNYVNYEIVRKEMFNLDQIAVTKRLHESLVNLITYKAIKVISCQKKKQRSNEKLKFTTADAYYFAQQTDLFDGKFGHTFLKNAQLSVVTANPDDQNDIVHMPYALFNRYVQDVINNSTDRTGGYKCLHSCSIKVKNRLLRENLSRAQINDHMEREMAICIICMRCGAQFSLSSNISGHYSLHIRKEMGDLGMIQEEVRQKMNEIKEALGGKSFIDIKDIKMKVDFDDDPRKPIPIPFPIPRATIQITKSTNNV